MEKTIHRLEYALVHSHEATPPLQPIFYRDRIEEAVEGLNGVLNTLKAEDQFIEAIFEIAFGEGSFKEELLKERDYQTVIDKIMEYSDLALKLEETRLAESVGTIIGFVLKMGPDCYKDTKRFPSGPWCKKGDFILMRTYTGTRFKIHGKEFRFINDDSVEGVVEDPRGYERL